MSNSIDYHPPTEGGFREKKPAQKIIESHLVEGRMQPGEDIGLKIDQTLTQDATGTMVMLEFYAMDILRVKTDVSVQYVDHNLQTAKNKHGRLIFSR